MRNELNISNRKQEARSSAHKDKGIERREQKGKEQVHGVYTDRCSVRFWEQLIERLCAQQLCPTKQAEHAVGAPLCYQSIGGRLQTTCQLLELVRN